MARLEHKTRAATLAFEQRATPEPARSAWLAAGPILSLLLVTLACLYLDGRASAGMSGPASPTLLSIIGAANAYWSMALGAGTALLISIALSLSSQTLTFPGALRASWHGMQRILGALVILYLAWGLGEALETIGTAHALTNLLTNSVTAWSLPALTFLVAAVVSSATGSSFSTMAILIPLVVPLAVTLAAGTAGPPVLATVGLSSPAPVLATISHRFQTRRYCPLPPAESRSSPMCGRSCRMHLPLERFRCVWVICRPVLAFRPLFCSLWEWAWGSRWYGV